LDETQQDRAPLEIVPPIKCGYSIAMFFCNFAPAFRVSSLVMPLFGTHKPAKSLLTGRAAWMVAAMLLLGLGFADRVVAADPEGAKGTNEVAAQQILNRFIEVSGGETVLRKFTNRLSIGSFESLTSGFQGTIEIVQSAPRRVSQKLIFADAAAVQMASDGNSAWIQAPGIGLQLMDGLQRDQFIDENDLLGILDFPQRLTNVMVLTPVNIDGVSCVPVTGVSRFGKKETLFFGKESGLLMRWDRQKLDSNANWSNTQTYFDKYRDVDGVQIPFKIAQLFPADQAFSIVLTSVTHDFELKPERFKTPTP
jgi:hypothetical protein